MNTEVIEEEANEWSYFVWKCENSDERMRPRGKPISSGCGEVNIRKSKQILKRGNDIQDKCRNCRRGRRLNGGNTAVFYTKEEAVQYKEGLE
mgnify:CR=1 FL=1